MDNDNAVRSPSGDIVLQRRTTTLRGTGAATTGLARTRRENLKWACTCCGKDLELVWWLCLFWCCGDLFICRYSSLSLENRPASSTQWGPGEFSHVRLSSLYMLANGFDTAELRLTFHLVWTQIHLETTTGCCLHFTFTFKGNLQKTQVLETRREEKRHDM